MDQHLTPEQYFLNLANNDVSKYNELLTLSKQFISGALSSCVQFNGCGNNGKAIFIKLLEVLVKFNNIKIRRVESHWLEDDEMIELMVDYDYIIIHDADEFGSTKLVSLINTVSSKINAKFILITNKLTTIPGTIWTIHMNAVFTRHNKIEFYFNQWSETRKREYFNFIMK